MKRAIRDENGTDISVKSPKKGKIITALVLICVIILNIALSLLTDANLWRIDMTLPRYKSTDSGLYTLSDTCRELIGSQSVPLIEEVNRERESRGEEKIKLNIIFCADKDVIESDSMTRYVNMTARSLQKAFPDVIDVQYINISKNPSAVQRFKTTSASKIYNSDVIVEFGSEYLVQSIGNFFYQDDGKTSPWAYNGEQRLSAMILSLTQAESPICAITTNHGETLFTLDGEVKGEYSTFIKLIGGAGYDVAFIDLENDEIPENCRMMITFDPQTDFKAFGNLGESGVSEIEKLDKYLERSNSFFYICSRETPTLKNLEEYLEEWGIVPSRVKDGSETYENYIVRDGVNCTDTGRGDIVVGKYGENGVSGGITAQLRDQAYPPMVIFGEPTAISVSDSYMKTYVRADESEGTEAYSYFSYYKNGVNRAMFDVFSTYDTASAYIGGEVHEIATEFNLFNLMTITRESRIVQETNYTSVDQSSYVISLASTAFLKNDVLDSAAYGNADVLLSTLRRSGVEAVPANVRLKAFYVYEMEDIMTDKQYQAQRNTWLICLTVIPAVAAVAVGTVVVVKRRRR